MRWRIGMVYQGCRPELLFFSLFFLLSLLAFSGVYKNFYDAMITSTTRITRNFETRLQDLFDGLQPVDSTG